MCKIDPRIYQYNRKSKMLIRNLYSLIIVCETELYKDRILDLVRLQQEVKFQEESNSRLEAQ